MNIGTAYLHSNNLTDALAHYTRAEAIYRDTFPPDSPNIADCMRNISLFNEKLGNADIAAAAAAASASTARRSQSSAPRRAAPAKSRRTARR